jgi:hypothetical protein
MKPRGNPSKLKPFKKGFDERRHLTGPKPKTIEKMIEEGGYDMGEVIAMLHKKAVKMNDVRAAEVLISYVYAKPKQSIDIDMEVNSIIMPIIKIERS